MSSYSSSNEYYVNFYTHQTVNKVLARQNIEKTQLTVMNIEWDYNYYQP